MELIRQQSVWTNRIGWFATAMAIVMYSSTIEQIVLNLQGHQGALLLPLAMCVNAGAWTAYGAMKRPRRDWIIITSNMPGIALGAVTALTAVA